MNIEFCKRVSVLLLGLISAGFGVGLFILSNVGSDPFSVFMQGLSNVFGITVGQSTIAISVLYAFIIFLLDKEYIRVGMLISVIALGFIIDVAIFLLTPIITDDMAFVIRIVTMIMATALIALGIAIVYCAKIGMVPNDALPLIIAKKINLPFKWVRISYDLLALVIGVILGGVFGYGTVICVLLLGPLIALFIPLMESSVNKIVFKGPLNA